MSSRDSTRKNSPKGKATTQASFSGPASYVNWKAEQQNEPRKYTIEVPLYSDARVAGALYECKPYELHHVFRRSSSGVLDTAVILRAHIHLELTDMAPRRNYEELKTETEAFTGSSIGDEVACLWSLLLGGRFMAGGVTRLFQNGLDPLGKPENDDSVPIAFFNFSHRRPILPMVCEEKQISRNLFFRYPDLVAKDAVALVRAARAYRNAIWIAEAEPDLAWLLLVSALEIAASRYLEAEAKGKSEDKLRSLDPELAKLLIDCGGEDHLKLVANHIAGIVRSAERFKQFMREFLPDPPKKRPAERFRVDWDPSRMIASLGKVYSLRSNALHGGIPFPRPMSRPAEMPGGHGDVPSEIEISLAVSTLGGTWKREDMPFKLHVFEYITRNTLLGWWERMAGVRDNAG